MADISRYVDKAYEHLEFADLVDQPVDAIEGISKADAEALHTALGIKTIRQLADHKAVRVAQALTLMAGPRTGTR